jgi:hypothetical protein
MPTVLRIGPYRFFFFAGDRDEPPHVHIERDDQLAKFWRLPDYKRTAGSVVRRSTALSGSLRTIKIN